MILGGQEVISRVEINFQGLTRLRSTRCLGSADFGLLLSNYCRFRSRVQLEPF